MNLLGKPRTQGSTGGHIESSLHGNTRNVPGKKSSRKTSGLLALGILGVAQAMGE